MAKLFKYSLFIKAAMAAIVVLAIKYFTDRYGFSQIAINTLTSSFFAGVFFTISILFTAAMTDFKEAEKIPGELAVLLKALHNDARMASTSINGCTELKDISSHAEDLLRVITKSFRNNYWHKSLIDEQINKINDDIADLWRENVAPGILLRLRENLTNIDRLSHRIDYIAYTNDIPGAHIVADLALGAVFLIFIFAQNDWGIGGFVLFGAITFVLSALMLLIHDMDNPFEYGRNTLADVDVTVLFELEKYLKKAGQPAQSI